MPAKTGGRRGFTLLELIAVVALLGLVMVFAAPKFEGKILQDNRDKAFRWIIHTVRDTKLAAARAGLAHILHLDVDNGAIWTSTAGMSEEALAGREESGYRLPEYLALEDVEFPGGERVSGGRADIFFSARGYADKSAIHLIDEDGNRFTLLIEPFLPRIRRFSGYISLDE